MQLDHLIMCTLVFQFVTIKITKNNETEEATTSKTTKLDKFLLELPEKRCIYEKLYQEMHHRNIDNVRLWPALDMKSPDQLADIAHHFASCIGKKEHILKADIDYKFISYPLRHYKPQIVAMLRCKIGKNVYRFIEGVKNYCAFLVLRRISGNERFFIAAALLKSMLPHLDFLGMESTKNSESDIATISKTTSDCQKSIPPDQDFRDINATKDRESDKFTIFKTTELKCLIEPREKRYVYEKLFQETNHRSLGKVKLWPALGNKTPNQLTGIAHHLSLCIGIKEYIQFAQIDYKVLSYPLTRYKLETVAMLKCRMGKNVYRFIEGNENYHAFMVLKLSSNSERFFIATACLKSIIPNLTFHNPDEVPNIGNSRTKRRLEFQGSSDGLDLDGETGVNLEDGNIMYKQLKCQEPVEKLFEYEKIHQKKYIFEDFNKYKSWPLIEKRSLGELFTIAKGFATCVGIDEPIEKMFIKEEERPLQYSTKNYKAITVKMLGCHQSGKRSYYFIDGVGDYTSFLVTRMNYCKKQKLFITAACHKGSVVFGDANEHKFNYDI